MSILIPTDTVQPRFTYDFGINHDIDLLRVVPGLRVLVSVALDTHVLVYDHDFDWEDVSAG